MNPSDTTCPVCGRIVDQAGTRAPRQYHPECKKVANYLGLAVKYGGYLEGGQVTARRLRALFFAAGNRFRAPQPRSADGRFASRAVDPDE